MLASGSTVIVALLVLLLGRGQRHGGLGPVVRGRRRAGDAGMLTVLPALLRVSGRRAFWPFIPHFGDAGADETHGLWRRVGERVARAPPRGLDPRPPASLVLCLGLDQLNTDLTSANGFRGSVDSVQGQKLLSQGSRRAQRADERRRRRRRPGCPQCAAPCGAAGRGALGPVERGAAGARFDLTLAPTRTSKAAFDQIPKPAPGGQSRPAGRRRSWAARPPSSETSRSPRRATTA